MGRKPFSCSIHKARKKGCSDGCIFREIFPGSNENAFNDAAKVFGGIAGLLKLIKLNPVSSRFKQQQAALSLLYEANIRVKDPVHGVTGVLRSLLAQNIEADEELRDFQTQLAFYRANFQKLVHPAQPVDEAVPPPVGAEISQDPRVLHQQSLIALDGLMRRLEDSKEELGMLQADYAGITGNEMILSSAGKKVDPESSAWLEKMREDPKVIVSEAPPIFQNILNELNQNQKDIQDVKLTLEKLKRLFADFDETEIAALADAAQGEDLSGLLFGDVGAAAGVELEAPSGGGVGTHNAEDFFLDELEAPSGAAAGVELEAPSGGGVGPQNVEDFFLDDEEKQKTKKQKMV